MNTTRRGSFLSRGQQPCNLDQGGRARAIVVRPVVNLLVAGDERALSAESQVIVVGADDDGFVGVRPFAFENRDNVFHFRFAAGDVDLARESPAGNLATVRRRPFVDLFFQRRQVGAERFFQHPIDHLAFAMHDRNMRRVAPAAGAVESQERVEHVRQILVLRLDVVGQFFQTLVIRDGLREGGPFELLKVGLCLGQCRDRGPQMGAAILDRLFDGRRRATQNHGRRPMLVGIGNLAKHGSIRASARNSRAPGAGCRLAASDAA